MRYSQRRKRNYIIMGLCMVLAVMAVSYAAFSQQLTINSSAGTTTKWCLGFDTTVTGNVSATAGLTGATAPTGTITYDGNTCDGNYNSGASLSSTLHQPGDTVTYTLTIKNSSTIDAAINSITVNDQNTVSDKEVKLGNIVFVVGMPESTSLSAGSSTTMTVTARFQDETDITGGYNGENASITVNVNASQDGGSGGFVKKYTGTIYRNSTEKWITGNSIKSGAIYNITMDGEYGHGPVGDYNTLDECQSILDNNYGGSSSGLQCKAFSKNLEYTINPSTLNKNYYLKYDILDDIIINSYTCFVINDKEYCLNSYNNYAGDIYADNKELLLELANSGALTCQESDSVKIECSGSGFEYISSLWWEKESHVGISASSVCTLDGSSSYCT